MASTHSATTTTCTSRKKGPPCRGWEELRRQRNAKILEAVLNDSDSDPDYQPSSDETELTQPDTETESAAVGTEEEQFSPTITRGRKRLRRPDEWVKNKKKKARNSGQEYEDYKGRTVQAKSLPDLTNHMCRRKCTEKVTPADMQEFHAKFWALGDHTAQDAFLAGSVTVQKKSRHRKHKGRKGIRKPKTYSRYYKLKTSSADKMVCKKLFLDVLQISNGRLSRALEKKVDCTDNRGRHGNHKRVDMTSVREHINCFPRYISHYTRAHHSCEQQREYLSPSLNLSLMYELYVAKCNEDKKVPLKEWAYRHCFNTEYNLSFKLPKKDTCKACDVAKVAIDAEKNKTQQEKLRKEHELHLRKAESAREKLKSSKDEVNDKTEVFTFDLQKTLPTPDISSNEAYYSRQLWTYNLGVHSVGTGKAWMYMWHEGMASRGPDEIGSCIMKFVEMKTAEGVENFVGFSDSCGGQNRNFKMAMLGSYIASSGAATFEQRFMKSGHSFLPNDADFGVIERAKGRQEIFVPEHWMQLVRQARKKDPFTVVAMKQSEFVTLADYIKTKAVNRKKTSDGEKVEWLQIQWLRFEKERPLVMKFKYSLGDGEWCEVDFERKTRGRPSTVKAPRQLYPNGRPVAGPKMTDLKKLLKYVPPVHHSFYSSLETSVSQNASSDIEYCDSDTE